MTNDSTTSDSTTDADVSRNGDDHFLVGFILGSAFCAGLTMLLAPRVAAELGQRVTDSAKRLGRAASERQQRTGARIGNAVGDLTNKGQGVRDDVLEAVASGARRGAQKVERFAADHSTAPAS